ncbi:hypothetical protein [Streptomyces acidicola]|uniref:Uncharacterized protein n=1 Tax=Streptomyces acidicola TaxID=2596892 RepID=A0A5N8X666_9ACTN|nr:hypothetical protein [Streptomyces acidicola]MPY54949.1 hypothetical protein [Streptomyces acidicola]
MGNAAADVFQIASDDLDATATLVTAVTAVVGTVAALVGVVIGARIGARGARDAARTQARAGYTTALEQNNQEARRAAYIDLYTAGQSFLKDLKDFARLNSRTVGPDDRADPFAEHRDRVSRAVAAIRILGPRRVWQHARDVERGVNGVTWWIKADHDVFYGWRNLVVARQATSPIPDVANAARTALIRIYNARSDRAGDEVHAAAAGPLQDAEAAGIVTNAQRQSLHADPTGVGAERLRPEEKLSAPWEEAKEALDAFADAAGACLEDTNLPST